MSKLRNVYLYLVSFVSLMMILIGLIFTVQSVTDVLFPTNYYYDAIPKSSDMTEDEKRKYEEYQKRNEENMKTDNRKRVAKNTAVVLVGLPTFIYHWKKIEKEKKESL